MFPSVSFFNFSLSEFVHSISIYYCCYFANVLLLRWRVLFDKWCQYCVIHSTPSTSPPPPPPPLTITHQPPQDRKTAPALHNNCAAHQACTACACACYHSSDCGSSTDFTDNGNANKVENTEEEIPYSVLKVCVIFNVHYYINNKQLYRSFCLLTLRHGIHLWQHS